MRYGLTERNMTSLYQSSRCRLCGLETVDIRNLHVDHDFTHKIRGLVCIHCNHVIAVVESTPEYFQDHLWKREKFLNGENADLTPADQYTSFDVRRES
jgi:hypothetical protein